MNTIKQLIRSKFAIGIMPLTCLVALDSQAVNLNYESLSSLEEPIAFEIGDTTFSLNGLFDGTSAFGDDPEEDPYLLGNFQLSAETQLPNSWTLGASYFGSYSGSELEQDNYQDNAAVFLGGVWGTLAIGNVTGLVREQTRRRRGVGNAVLDFDDQLGTLGDLGVAFHNRLGPAQFIATADEDGGFEIGSIFQRPIGNKDYRFSIRYRDSEFLADDDVSVFDSKSIGFVSELTYGSTVLDFGFGYEQLDADQLSADRIYASIGASRKWGAWSSSLEAHFGQVEGQDESSLALGVRYDIARGLSLNLGVNYRDALVELNEFRLLDQSGLSGVLSMRYSF